MPSFSMLSLIWSGWPSALTPGSVTRSARLTPRRLSSQPASAAAPGPNLIGVASRVKTVSWLMPSGCQRDAMDRAATCAVTGALDLVALEQLLSDHHALDLGGALADQQQRGVAVQPLDLVLLRVAVTALDPEGVLDDLLAGLGGEQLRHAGLQIAALARVLHARGLQRQQAGGL